MEAIAFDFLKSITFEFCSRSELRSLWREIEEVIRLLEGYHKKNSSINHSSREFPKLFPRKFLGRFPRKLCSDIDYSIFKI